MFLFARCLHLLVIREWRCQDIDQVLLHGRCFSPVHSAVLKYETKIDLLVF